MIRALAAVVLLALLPAPAGAVTLMVNGDTPSARWQKVVDLTTLTYPDEQVGLYFAAPPGDFADGAFVDYTPEAPARIYVDPDLSAREVSATLFHELGHLAEARWWTAADRAEFRRIWAQPTLPWEDVPYREPIPGIRVVDSDQSDALQEWLGDALAACAVVDWTFPRDMTARSAVGALSIIPVERMRPALVKQRLIATCRLYRQAED